VKLDCLLISPAKMSNKLIHETATLSFFSNSSGNFP
jgi:hypothetical protein